MADFIFIRAFEALVSDKQGTSEVCMQGLTKGGNLWVDILGSSDFSEINTTICV